MENMCLDELKRKVTDKPNKIKLVHIVWLCLKYVEFHTEAISEAGIFWIDGKNFMLNSTIFCDFINQKPNTINRSFRNHGFDCKKTKFSMRAQVLEMYPDLYLPDPKNWTIRHCDGFSRETTENEAKNWKSNEIVYKQPQEKNVKQNKIKNDIEVIRANKEITYNNNNLCINNNDIISNNISNFNINSENEISKSNNNIKLKNEEMNNRTSNQTRFNQIDGENELYAVLEELEINNCEKKDKGFSGDIKIDVEYENNTFQQFELDFYNSCDFFQNP